MTLVIDGPPLTAWSSATTNSDVVLLLGVADVKASKQFYVDRGLAVAKSFGSKYVEFETAGSPVKLALYSRRAAAKDAGVSRTAPDRTGSSSPAMPGPSPTRTGSRGRPRRFEPVDLKSRPARPTASDGPAHWDWLVTVEPPEDPDYDIRVSVG
ncbi:hypothetical protein [Micromonospora sp. DT47]|uniref:hypothetical protein n=1 Tax=Micromonospora sp. DT47 TaxID=3393431 RepID=UPI003CEF66B7